MDNTQCLPNASGIYRITNLVNGKNYVGQTASTEKPGGFRKRKITHFCELRNGHHGNDHLQKAFDKYGEQSFAFLVLEIVTDLTRLSERERYWILKLNTLNPDYGYNLSFPGLTDCPRRLSDETRAKISTALLGREKSEETRAKLSASHKGRKFTAETRAKLSAARKGKPNGRAGERKSAEHREKIARAKKGQVPWMKGRTHSDESKEKMSETRKGTPWSQARRDAQGQRQQQKRSDQMSYIETPIGEGNNIRIVGVG